MKQVDRVLSAFALLQSRHRPLQHGPAHGVTGIMVHELPVHKQRQQLKGTASIFRIVILTQPQDARQVLSDSRSDEVQARRIWQGWPALSLREYAD